MQRKPSDDLTTAFPETCSAGRALTFRLGEHEHAIRISLLSGLDDEQPIRTIHGAPEAVLGLTEVRGNLLMVVDLSLLLGYERQQGPGCFLRLAAPCQNTALYLPSQLHMVAASEARDLRWVDAAEMIGSLPSSAGTGTEGD